MALGCRSLRPGLFATSYTWLMWPHPASQKARERRRDRLALLLFVALALQVTVLSLMDGAAWLWLFIGTSVLTPM